jgi:hypothetical protein
MLLQADPANKELGPLTVLEEAFGLILLPFLPIFLLPRRSTILHRCRARKFYPLGILGKWDTDSDHSHALRKSGTFTALDFAALPRFNIGSGASDAGSIRSNRTAMSPVRLHNIRAGAYRVSRIPREISGTKDELSETLRPQWGMRP